MQDRARKQGMRARSEGWEGLSGAVRDFQAGLDVAVDVHEAPFVFPVLARCIVADLPWLVKC